MSRRLKKIKQFKSMKMLTQTKLTSRTNQARFVAKSEPESVRVTAGNFPKHNCVCCRHVVLLKRFRLWSRGKRLASHVTRVELIIQPKFSNFKNSSAKPHVDKPKTDFFSKYSEFRCCVNSVQNLTIAFTRVSNQKHKGFFNAQFRPIIPRTRVHELDLHVIETYMYLLLL